MPGEPPELEAIQQASSAVAFCSIISAQVGNVMTCRSDQLSAFAVSCLDNPWIGLGIGADVVLASGPTLLLAEEARKDRRRRERQLD